MGGLAAAITAADEGCDVVLVEKNERLGGAAAYSGGQVWIGDNHVARREGCEPDTYDEVLETLATEAEKRINKAKERNIPLWMLYKPDFNWLQQGQASGQTPEDVADNLDLPPPPPSNS